MVDSDFESDIESITLGDSTIIDSFCPDEIEFKEEDLQATAKASKQSLPSVSQKRLYAAPHIRPPRISAPKKERGVPPPNMSPEDIAKHEGLVLKITRYGTSPRFGDYLKKTGLHFDNLRMKTIDELDEMLARIKVAMSNKSPSGMVNHLVFMGTGTVEGVTTSIPSIKAKCDLTGFNKALQEDDSFKDLLEELSLEYGMVSALSPEKRLLWALASKGMTVAMLNKVKAASEQKTIAPPSEHQQEPRQEPIAMPSSQENHKTETAEVNEKKNKIEEAPALF